MKRQRFWLSITFRKLFICYVAVLLLPILFNFLVYKYFATSFAQKNEEAHQQVLYQTATVIDERLEAVRNICDTVSVSSTILKLRSYELPFNAEKYYQIHQHGKYLYNFSVLDNVIQHIYVYCPQLDAIIDPGHIYTEMNQLHTIITQKIGVDREEFRQIMAEEHHYEFILTNEGNSIVCLHTLSRNSRTPMLTLVIVLNTQSIVSALDSAGLNNEGNAYILALNGDALGKKIGGAVSLREMEFQPGEIQLIRQDNTVTMALSSGVSQLVYLFSVPVAAFMREINTIRFLYLIGISILFLLGVITCYFLASRNYQPIYKLKQITDIQDNNQNDMAAIQGKIKEVLESKQKMHQEINRLNSIASHQAFHALIVGDMDCMREETHVQLGINFLGELFVAAIIDLDTYKDKKPVLALNYLGELNVVIHEILKELCHHSCQYLVRWDEDAFIVIFCFQEMDENTAQMKALEIMEGLLGMIQQNLSVATLAYIGDTQHGLDCVHVSYETARKAKEYTEFVGETEKRIILYDPSMFAFQLPSENYDIMDTERRFSNLLLSGDYDQAKKLLYQIVTYYRYRDGMSFYIMRCRMFGLMNLMLNAIHELEPDLDAAFYKECKPIEHILSAKNMRELEEELFSIVDQLIDRKELHVNDVQEKIRLIVGYIKTHYYDSNLSVQFIADQFNMSLPYLSRIFKENMQIGLLTYINQYRVDKAKEILMEDGNATLTDVAERVGYNCSQTLIRTFKRHEGVTPGIFRTVSTSPTTIETEGKHHDTLSTEDCLRP